MNLLVVGGGGREYAIIKKLKENKSVSAIYALPGNGGIAADATCVSIGATDIDKIVEFAVANAIDYAVVAPDDPLVLGCVDKLNAAGVPCFGPDAKAAIIEGSKAFSKNLMKKYGILRSFYRAFRCFGTLKNRTHPHRGQGGRTGFGQGRDHRPDPGRGGRSGHRHDGKCQVR